MDGSQIVLVLAGLLHLGFVGGEMIPWRLPLILKRIMADKNVGLSGGQLTLTATIVRNAGIYNLILAAGFFWLAMPDAFGPTFEPVGLKAVRCFFLGGAVIAGLFGMTLSALTIVQAIVGLAGLVVVLMH